MKRTITIMSFATLVPHFTFAAEPIPASLNLSNLSYCETQVTAAYTSQLPLVSTSAKAVGVGAAYGAAVFGGGATSVMITDSLVSSVGATNIIFGGAGELAVASDPFRGIILSAVGTGLVVAAISFGLEYQAYQSTVDRAQSLVQYFKDVKNNGMGPQIEVRADQIQTALRKVSALDKITGSPKVTVKYNPETYSEANVVEMLVNVGSDLLAATTVDCSNIDQISYLIDSTTMRRLIEKYNPGLAVR